MVKENIYLLGAVLILFIFGGFIALKYIVFPPSKEKNTLKQGFSLPLPQIFNGGMPEFTTSYIRNTDSLGNPLFSSYALNYENNPVMILDPENITHRYAPVEITYGGFTFLLYPQKGKPIVIFIPSQEQFLERNLVYKNILKLNEEEEPDKRVNLVIAPQFINTYSMRLEWLFKRTNMPLNVKIKSNDVYVRLYNNNNIQGQTIVKDKPDDTDLLIKFNRIIDLNKDRSLVDKIHDTRAITQDMIVIGEKSDINFLKNYSLNQLQL